MARFKWSKRLEALEELAATKLGKIDKKALWTSSGREGS